MLTNFQLDIYIMIFQTRGACQRIKWKRERWGSPWLKHKVKTKHKVKDRPFAEGSRGCHVRLGLMHKILMQKNVTLYCPCMWTFIMKSVAFITSTTRSYKAYFLCTNKSCIFREQFLLLAPMTTYLKDLTQSIGRYGGLSWQNWV